LTTAAVPGTNDCSQISIKSDRSGNDIGRRRKSVDSARQGHIKTVIYHSRKNIDCND